MDFTQMRGWEWRTNCYIPVMRMGVPPVMENKGSARIREHVPQGREGTAGSERRRMGAPPSAQRRWKSETRASGERRTAGRRELGRRSSSIRSKERNAVTTLASS
jgi:hypothetical protein